MLDSIFEVVFLIGLIATWMIRIPHNRRNKHNRITDDRKTGLEEVLLILTFISMQIIPFFYVLTPWLDFADYHLPTWAAWVGVATFAVALWLFWRSHADLGRNWSATLEIREGHSLVTHGVYRHIRHPMYAAFWLWGIAQPLLLHRIGSLVWSIWRPSFHCICCGFRVRNR